MFCALISIASIGFFVWSHHMYTVGLDIDTRAYFVCVTMVIGIPTSLKILNWLYSL